MKSIELINLTLNEIRRSAQMVADVEADYRNLIFNMEKEGFDAEQIGSTRNPQTDCMKIWSVAVSLCVMSLRI